MIENEAIRELVDYVAENDKVTISIEAVTLARKALEEIQQYRAIGSVLKVQVLDRLCELQQCELKQYRAIGTVEKFKALKEKNVPKKPKQSGVYDNKGEFHPINGINGVPYDLCPCCETNLCTDGFFGNDKKKLNYCKNCGQALDWSEGE